MRPRLERLARVLLDVLLVVGLVLLGRSGDPTLWLHVTYLLIALYALLRPSPVSVAVRATIVGAVAGAELLYLHNEGRVPLDDVSEVPLLTAFAYLFSGYAALRLRSERKATADSARLRQLIDAVPFATMALDQEANVVTWNGAAERLFGWASSEIVGRKNPSVAPEDQEASLELHRRLMRGETLRGVEVSRRTRDDERLELALWTAPIDAAAGPRAGFLVLYDDISERKRAERERDEAQRLYRSLVEELPLVTYIDEVDDDATNVYTSPQVVEMLGWPAEEWERDPVMYQRLLHPDDRARVLSLVRQSNRTRALFEAEYRLRHRDGHYAWVRDHSSIVEDADGRAFARGFLLDITAQKQLEEQLRQAQKMEAVGQLAGGVAHDFNNLLTAIIGYADLALASSRRRSSRLHAQLAQIRTAGAERREPSRASCSHSAAGRCCSRSARPSTSTSSPGEHRAMLRACWCARTCELAARLRRRRRRGRGRPGQLEQVAVNLALNARDAMPGGGALTHRDEGRRAGHRPAATCAERRQRLRHGRGDPQARVFEPFFTTKPPGEGTGLGLALAYGVVESLGGRLTIVSAPGKGTTVEVALPGSELPEAAEEPAEQSSHRGVGRVLVVEDRDLVRELTCDVLASAGFEVRRAVSGPGGARAGRLRLRVRPARDRRRHAGAERRSLAGRPPARAPPDLPVLYMSGYTDDVLGSQELMRPHTTFLRKPFGNADLITAVRAALDGYWAAAALANATSPGSAAADCPSRSLR